MLATMTNSDFLQEVFGEFDSGTFTWVAHFRADPSQALPTVWSGRPYKAGSAQAAMIDKATEDNTYFCTAVLQAFDGELARKKENFVRLAVLVLDDVQMADVPNFSYAIQTSPGKFQVGIFLDADDPDAKNKPLIDRVMSSLAARGRSNDASGNALVRYVRLPEGHNTKARAAGDWQVRLEAWNPNIRWSLEDACAAVGIDLDALRNVIEVTSSSSSMRGTGTHAGEMIASLTDPSPSARVYHDSIIRLAGSLVAGGMFPGAAVEFLYSLMDQARPGDPMELARWQARRAEIPRAVESAKKFAPEERKPAQITVNLGGSPSEPEIPAGDLVPLDWVALKDTTPEPITWALEGWLPHKHVTLLAANGGVGKSNLALQLAVAVATDDKFMGIETSPGRVLVISAEDDRHLVHLRVSNICAATGTDMEDLHNNLVVYDMTQTECALWANAGPTPRMQWLADTVMRHKPALVILDNASDLFAGNENDRAEVRGFLRCLKTIGAHSGAAMLLLAHVDKASVRSGAGADTDSTFSGSTAWNNSARSRWAMVTGNDKREVMLKHEKCNVGPKQEPFSIEFDASGKIFRTFGTVPGAASAAALVRNGHRIAILHALEAAERAGQRVSMSANANNNAFRVLKNSPGFPRIERGDFFSLLYELQREGLVQEDEYTGSNRAKAKCITLTEAGRATGAGLNPYGARRGGPRDED